VVEHRSVAVWHDSDWWWLQRLWSCCGFVGSAVVVPRRRRNLCARYARYAAVRRGIITWRTKKYAPTKAHGPACARTHKSSSTIAGSTTTAPQTHQKHQKHEHRKRQHQEHEQHHAAPAVTSASEAPQAPAPHAPQAPDNTSTNTSTRPAPEAPAERARTGMTGRLTGWLADRLTDSLNE
jgi:hypothetical protein